MVCNKSLSYPFLTRKACGYSFPIAESDVSQGMRTDSLQANYLVVKVVFLNKNGCLLAGLPVKFEALVMVLLSEVASSISLAIGPGFLVSLAVITYFNLWVENNWKKNTVKSLM